MECGITIFAIVLAIFAGAVVMLLFGYEPLAAYSALLKGAFGTVAATTSTLTKSVPIMLTGLAVAVAFKCGVFNIGAEGQLLMGALFAGIAGIYVDFLPAVLHIPLTLAAAVLGGMIWAFIPAVMKQKFQVNVVIGTIMFNYIGEYFVQYMILNPMKAEGVATATNPLSETALLPKILTAPNVLNLGSIAYTDYGNPYISEEYKEYLKEKNLPQAVHHIVKSFYVDGISDRGDWDGMEPGADYQCKSWWCGEHAVGVTTTPKETHESFFLANLACEKLEEIAKSKEERPFSLRVDFWGPHQPHFPTQEFLDMYEDFHLPPYGNFSDTLRGKPKTYFRERNVPLGENDVLIQPSVMEWTDWEVLIKYCFAHQTMIDAAGGMIIDKLHELGLDKNTLIVWTSDHGDGLACHGGHFDKGSYMCEEVLRIPFAMKWEGVISPGQIRSELVSTVDFPVTLLDAAGLKYTKNKVDGKSILPLVTGTCSEWREDLMSETQGHGYGDDTMARAIRYKDWKYIVTKDDVEELYNLKEDEFELKNLAEDKEYQIVLEDMRTRLEKWQKETDDTFQMR